MVWPKDRLTRFEVARIISARALQIEYGAPCFVKIKGDPITKAREEFKRKLIPMSIKRKMPDGSEIIVDIKKAIDNWLKERKYF